ncbi:hypothetical protein [Nonomuraea sp. NPDC052265]|uniref:hypothetical protein n=1 Tax=Nonomuraea sp. NPDC052265 TaxID=3364374 RepID=UPI0037C5C2DA
MTTPLRKDAARNWERIVTVARELIDEGTPPAAQRRRPPRRAGRGHRVPLMCGIAYAAAVHGGTPTARVPTAHRYLTLLLEGLHA